MTLGLKYLGMAGAALALASCTAQAPSPNAAAPATGVVSPYASFNSFDANGISPGGPAPATVTGMRSPQ